ncbi:DUF7218 family protein [Xanthomarina sp.]|uniref:DUF7218 family protein n=1 Tax=Xanthomarina sp. TaxID=1931211 RepID=UPI002C7ABDC3|nr:Rho termination factor [Xanthomarina sp.]HLV39595.1 hypothetical protein [Xanthomarina sp.]
MAISSIKNNDQYKALQDKGYSKEKAARHARTPDFVNKREMAKPYEEWTRSALYQQAKYIGIKGRSKMDKTELIHVLRDN